MSRKTSYSSKWEKDYQWITSVKIVKYSGYCKLCLKSFQIHGSRISQVKSHENSKSHKSNVQSNSQPRFNFSNAIVTEVYIVCH